MKSIPLLNRLDKEEGGAAHYHSTWLHHSCASHLVECSGTFSRKAWSVSQTSTPCEGLWKLKGGTHTEIFSYSNWLWRHQGLLPSLGYEKLGLQAACITTERKTGQFPGWLTELWDSRRLKTWESISLKSWFTENEGIRSDTLAAPNVLNLELYLTPRWKLKKVNEWGKPWWVTLNCYLVVSLEAQGYGPTHGTTEGWAGTPPTPWHWCKTAVVCKAIDPDPDGPLRIGSSSLSPWHSPSQTGLDLKELTEQ